MTPRTEAQVSRDVVKLLRTFGFAVWSTEQGWRKERGGTRQTPGIPDLIVIGHDRLLFVEMKGPKGRLRDSQKVFRDECRANGVPWAMWRSVGECRDWLVAEGILEEVA